MILDLTDATCPRELSAGVCIVGGGTAGCYLAHRLAARGREVVVLEAGGRRTQADAEVGFDPLMPAEPYGGVHDGRAFGLGGTSARWGGLIVPYAAEDEANPTGRSAATWAHIVGVVRRQTATVRQMLGLATPADFDTRARTILGVTAEELSTAGFAVRAAEMLPFGGRNLSRLVVKSPTGVRVVLNAVAIGWTLGSDGKGGRITSVRARSAQGASLTVRADEMVIAAGAIESARMLLELDRAAGPELLRGRRAIGRGLSDHLSARVALVDPAEADRAARLFGPRFVGPLMKTVRLVDRAALAERPRHFAHLVFAIENPGFELAKKVLFSLQARRLPRAGLAEVARATRGLAALAFDRFARGRLHVPAGTVTALQLDVEQLPRDDNAVTLADETDRLGRPRAVVRWTISADDRANIAALARGILARWNGLGPRLPRVTPIDPSGAEAKLHDAYHPVGVCRMGEDADAVAAHDLTVRGLENLRLLTTGLFPSAGTANPTFSLLCFAEELAGRLGRR